MEEGSPDIITKYQKLAAEYSKLRAQATVLKRAVSEEQGRNLETKDSLKEKDQCIRKLEQEVECLNFRNLQLTKRVSVLQNDLEATEERDKKVKNKTFQNSVSTSETESILNTELLSRIEENEKLHQQVFEAQSEQKKAVSELTQKIETLESQLSQQYSSLSTTIMKHEGTISRLSQERAKFELSRKIFEKDIKDVMSQDEICKQELDFVKQDLGIKLEEANRIIQEKILFHDKKWKTLNRVNVPVLLHQKHEQMSILIVDLKGVLSELLRRMSTLHSYMEQKLLGFEGETSDVSGPVKKLASHLHENTIYIKALDGAFTKFSIKVSKDASTWLDITCMKEISVAFSKYVRYLDKLLPYLLLSIQSENNSKGTTPRLKEIYRKLQIVSQSLIVGFSKLEKYIELLVETGCPNQNTAYCVSRQVLVKKIVSSLYSVQSQFEEARKVFGAKVVLDHDLPTITEKTKTTDDCILSSLVSISSGLRKIAVLLEEKIDVLDCEVPYVSRAVQSQRKLCIDPCVSELRTRGQNYMTLLRWNEPPSIPHEVALRNSLTLVSYADSRESLAQQLQACQSKLSKLELEKEHWLVECQLLRTKQARMSPSSASNTSDSSPDSDQTFQLFVKSSVNQLVTQIQFADSKALTFQNECECLYQKLKVAEHRKEVLESELGISRNAVDTLREEQRTLMKNYEDQLSTMSDHLATMNETLTQQKDEIDALKHAGNSKPSKKGKGK